MTTAIHTEDADTYIDPAEALMNRWKDASEPSTNEDDEGEQHGEEETNEEAEVTAHEADEPDDDSDGEDAEGEDSESETDEDADSEEPEDEDESDDGKTVIDSDDAVVKIKVDGEEVEASIKDLKRLYGQEASLTRKSQEAANIKKQAEEAGAYHVAGLEALYQRALKAAEPYKNINFLALTKDPNISQEELAALADTANAAFDNVRFLESELQNSVKFAQETRYKQLTEQARETNKILSDPKTGIEGWNEDLYKSIHSFAIEQGLDKAVVDEIVDPVSIKLLHMAMKYAKAAKVVTDPNKGPKRKDKTGKRIVKGAPTEIVRKNKPNVANAAMKKFRQTGSTDDAADALMARWSNS